MTGPHLPASVSAVIPNEPDETSPDEAEQSELDLGVISTGSPEVDRTLTPIERLGELPVAEHPEVFERVLGELSSTMTDSSADESSVGEA